MEEALIITTAIAVLLFIGLVCSWVGKKTNIPDVLLLILTGMVFGHLTFKGAPLVQFPTVFLNSVAILALAMIVFDSTARIRWRELDTFSLKASKITFIFTALCIILFSIAVHFILGLSWWVSILFSSIMTGTSPDVLMSLKGKTRTLTLLKLESIFNTPFTVLMPFIIIELMQKVTSNIFSDIIEQLVPFLLNVIIGLGAGLFVAIILFKIVQHAYTQVYSPLAVIVSALLAYVLSENLGGSGVLAVTALGVFFGNAYVKEKITILGIETVFTKTLYILVFLLAGLVIDVPFTKQFIFTSLLLLIIYTLIRFIAVRISTKADNYTLHEQIILTLCAPKGVATAAVVFILAVKNIPGMEIVTSMTFAFVLYSIILASITSIYENYHH